MVAIDVAGDLVVVYDGESVVVGDSAVVDISTQLQSLVINTKSPRKGRTRGCRLLYKG